MSESAGRPLDPTKEMIEAGAQRLVRWETGKETWPDSWSALDVRASRNDAEKVWRSMWLAAPSHAGPDAMAELIRLLDQRYQDMGDTLARKAADELRSRPAQVEVAGCLNLHLNAEQEKSVSVRTESDPSADGTSGRVLAPSPVSAPSQDDGLRPILLSLQNAIDGRCPLDRFQLATIYELLARDHQGWFRDAAMSQQEKRDG